MRVSQKTDAFSNFSQLWQIGSRREKKLRLSIRFLKMLKKKKINHTCNPGHPKFSCGRIKFLNYYQKTGIVLIYFLFSGNVGLCYSPS